VPPPNPLTIGHCLFGRIAACVLFGYLSVFSLELFLLPTAEYYSLWLLGMRLGHN